MRLYETDRCWGTEHHFLPAVLSTVMCQVSEVYLRRVQIAYSLMRPLIIPVANELLVGLEHLGFAIVCLMEGLGLADCRRPPYASMICSMPFPVQNSVNADRSPRAG